jgi:hypothetical protein
MKKDLSSTGRMLRVGAILIAIAPFLSIPIKAEPGTGDVSQEDADRWEKAIKEGQTETIRDIFVAHKQKTLGEKGTYPANYAGLLSVGELNDFLKKIDYELTNLEDENTVKNEKATFAQHVLNIRGVIPELQKHPYSLLWSNALLDNLHFLMGSALTSRSQSIKNSAKRFGLLMNTFRGHNLGLVQFHEDFVLSAMKAGNQSAKGTDAVPSK